MFIPIKTKEEISVMREGGKILATVLEEVLAQAKPGVSTAHLDRFAEARIKEKGGKPGFKGYRGFPSTLCTAINEVIVHGIPSDDQILKEGDLFTVDCGVIYKDMYTDAARSIAIGEVDSNKKRLIKTAHLALQNGINAAQPGNKINEIGRAIQTTVEKEGFKIIYDLTGHGIGKKLHEKPVVLNYFQNRSSQTLQPGMTIAIEPIFSVGTTQMRTLPDNWTIITSDRSPSVQQEETVLITKTSNEVLTKV